MGKVPTPSLRRNGLMGTCFFMGTLLTGRAHVGRTNDAEASGRRRKARPVAETHALTTVTVRLMRRELRGGRGAGQEQNEEAESDRGAHGHLSGATPTRDPGLAPKTGNDATSHRKGPAPDEMLVP